VVSSSIVRLVRAGLISRRSETLDIGFAIGLDSITRRRERPRRRQGEAADSGSFSHQVAGALGDSLGMA
jgi:hypothetical protein